MAWLAAASVLAAPAGGALAQPASNINTQDTRSRIAPRLPAPPVASYAPPQAFLTAARNAVAVGRTGEAQEALERAETRLLDRAVGPARADTPDASRAVLDIGVARNALAARDRPGAIRAIDDALAATSLAAEHYAQALPPPVAPPPLAPPPSAVAPPLPSPPQPAVTYALLPGHWALNGARWVWVPPDRTLRRVAERSFVPGQYVWRDGAWRWEPAHYAN